MCVLEGGERHVYVDAIFSTITRKFLSVGMREYNILFSLISTLFDFGMIDFV